MVYYFLASLLAALLCVFPLSMVDASLMAQVDSNTPPEILVEGISESESLAQPSSFASIIDPSQYQEEFITLPEILSQQVGVFVQGFGGLGQTSTVSIRGSTAEQVTVFIDGIRINTAQGGAVDFSSIPLGGIERIEVIRGGGSAQFGSDAIGGVINIVTKRASLKPFLEVRGTVGSFLTLGTHSSYQRRFKNLDLTLHHSHLSSKGNFSFVSTGVEFEDGSTIGGGKVFRRIHNSFVNESFLSRLDFSMPSNMSLSWTNDFFWTSRDQPGPEIETTVLYPQNPLQAHQNLFRNSSGLRWVVQDVAVPNLQFSLLPFYNLETSHFTDPSPSLGSPIDVRSTNHATGTKVKWLYDKNFRGHQHTFSLLYDFRYNFFSDSSPVASEQLIGKQTRWTNGIFFQDEISLIDQKVFFNPSARWENASDFGSNVAFHFGVIGRPWPWLTFKANVENSFRYPNFNELYLPDQGYIRGNPDLEEEKSLNADIGIQFQYQWVRASASYFRQDIKNSIIFVPISAFTIAPVNTGPVISQGFEFDFLVKPWEFLEISGNYTFLQARFKNSDQQLPGRPRHLANLKIQYRHAEGSVFTRLQYIDDLPIDFVNTKSLQNRLLIDVGGTYYFKKNYFLSAEIKNLANVQTLDSVGFPLPRLSVYLSFGYQG